MGAILWITEKLSKWMSVIAGAALTAIMLLTVCDVFLRYFFDRPIIGTFEMVGFGGAIAIGFSIPITSWMRGHIFVDFFVQKFNKVGQGIVNVITRLGGIALFYLIGYNLLKYGHDLYVSGEVSLTRQIPFYPIAYGMAICCFIQCLVLICDLFKIFGGQYE
ncbi:MAG: TRAP transporter small permease [Syntrophorhabdus sp.]|jgi:TRAP-type C4-dicarboxylate transport system permease small subunit|nr:TRAP transporter small permease [Syntrophorhabdus sp.]